MEFGSWPLRAAAFYSVSQLPSAPVSSAGSSPASACGLTLAILLLRHGPTALNHASPDKDRIRGWKDVPLSEEGHRIASLLAEKAKGFPLHDLHSSDLSRASDTADKVAKATGLRVQLDRSLRPWDLGKLAG